MNQKYNSEKFNTLNLNQTQGQEGYNESTEPEIREGLSGVEKSPLGVVQLRLHAEERDGIRSPENAAHFSKIIGVVERPMENIPELVPKGKIPITGKSIGPGSLLKMGKINLQEPVQMAGNQKNLSNGPRFSLALMFAPDVTALTLRDIEGLGNSVGLNLEYYIQPNLSINTGILYAFKTYRGGEGYYAGYQPAPSGIQGNCWILDVPINVRYYAFQRPLSRWYISGGVSTYLMLREKYGLEYYSYGHNYTKNLDLRNQNQHYFGIGNLSVGYERLLSDKLSLQIEPYFKVPINGIGEGQINLKSAGALIGLKYNW